MPAIMLSDKFYPTPIDQLLKMILHQHKGTGRIFGIPEALFFRPSVSDPFRTRRFGQLLETPIGLAAGPHTQLAQNIVAGWLTGARFIELKTIQTLDELEVSKPCIDMQDEGYNCEWSQELKIAQSFDQYLNAWIIIHVLKDYLGIGIPDQPGFIFNMSVGYHLKGILNDNVQWFLGKMRDASDELKKKIEKLKEIYPRIKEISIGSKLSDNVTLSTMHGCPPDEIELIAGYLLEQRGLHTSIKLNPTLAGRDFVNKTLSDAGFSTQVPDSAFDHDLKYSDAISIMGSLCHTATIHDLHFGVKLTNTLECINNRETFSPAEKMMYMSGRALHPISVSIAHKLQKDFQGRFNISFCGGADAFNTPDLLACGLGPVTVCSDILKPGGYGRLHQYIEEIRNAFNSCKAGSMEDFITCRANNHDGRLSESIMVNLESYAAEVRNKSAYKKTTLHDPNIKTQRPLGMFDCIHAPCEDTCSTNQDIPNYNHFAAEGNFLRAYEIITQSNPFPQVTGMICDHPCQLKCTRINYDHPVLIREIKRFVTETARKDNLQKSINKVTGSKKKAAVIGAGPSGLSFAAFLAKAGFKVQVYEVKPRPGGMLASGIPSFRLTEESLSNDIAEIEAFGIKINYGQKITRSHFEQLWRENDYLYIGVGAQRSARLNIPGNNAKGVLDPLQFLEELKAGKAPELGQHVLIIGGGNTAMDVARTAWRLIGDGGEVRIVYRRTIKEMPADLGEIQAVMNEGVEIMELVAPVKINSINGKVTSLTCIKMQLGPKDESGRPKPVVVTGSEFDLKADTIIPAVGQELDIDFCDAALLKTKPGSYETMIPGVFIGGDAMRGAATAIKAIGDGRKAAQEIIDRENIAFKTKSHNARFPLSLNEHMTMRARRMKPVKINETAPDERKNFNLVSSSLNQQEAVYEASRCLLCDEVCNICTTVCPNVAFHSYEIKPFSRLLQKFVRKNGEWVVINDDQPFEIKQQRQIIHIADWCNNCGNCNTFCPSAEAPYKIKPHLFISKEAFDAENEGFWLAQTNGKRILHRRSDGKISALVSENGKLIYESDGNRIVMEQANMEVNEYFISDFDGDEIGLQMIVEMSLILQGALEMIG